MNRDSQYQALIERLFEMRTRLIRQVSDLERMLDKDQRDPGAASNLPTHPADVGADAIFDNLAVADNEEHLLEQVEAALERHEAGSFGLCIACGTKIPLERLDALPFTPHCLACSAAAAH